MRPQISGLSRNTHEKKVSLRHRETTDQQRTRAAEDNELTICEDMSDSSWQALITYKVKYGYVCNTEMLV